MDFETTMGDLNLLRPSPNPFLSQNTSSGAPESRQKSWHESERDFSREEKDFLRPAQIREYTNRLTMPREIQDAFFQSTSLFRDLPAARRLAVHCRHTLFRARPGERPNTDEWPMLPRDLHSSSEMFYAHVFLSALPHALALAKERGIHEEIVLKTLQDIQLWIEDHKSKTGRWGLSQRGWFAYHFSGELYQLGRLQFQPNTFQHDFHFHRNRRDGRVIALAGQGMRFREDGQHIDADSKSWSPGDRSENNKGWTIQQSETDTGWTSEYRRDREKVFGYPLSPAGKALPKPVTLSAEEWPEILGKGDPVLDVHIPASGPLDPRACASSYERALPFFRKAFHELKPKALICTSWLMDNQLGREELSEEIPPESNILRFLRGYYLLPLPGTDDAQTLGRVFNGKTITDLDTAPQKTGLQRAVIRYMKEGGRWRMGLGVIFPEDLNRARDGLTRRYSEEQLLYSQGQLLKEDLLARDPMKKEVPQEDLSYEEDLS